MRIAVCFTGLAYGNGSERKRESLNSLASIRRFVYWERVPDVKLHCDTYFHAWVDNWTTEKELCALLKPKTYIAEKQKIFHEDGRCTDLDSFSETAEQPPSSALPGLLSQNHASLSQIYSRTESIKLALQSAEREGIKYDFIIVLRFDLHFKARIQFNNLSRDTLYDNGYRKKKPVYHGFFFIGSPLVMRQLIPMYDFAKAIVQKGNMIHNIHGDIFAPYFGQESLSKLKIERYLEFRSDYMLVRSMKKLARDECGMCTERHKQEMVEHALQSIDIEDYLSRNQVSGDTWDDLMGRYEYIAED
jgi:hypothetical protein